jgi:hypothetical protein
VWINLDHTNSLNKVLGIFVLKPSTIIPVKFYLCLAFHSCHFFFFFHGEFSEIIIAGVGFFSAA